jgi:tRNA-dihydrouridine synthase
MYKGEARWEWLRRLKEDNDIHIPIIGNGDASSPERVLAMFEETGVDAVMIGRGAIGNPWIFRDAKAFIATGELPEAPALTDRISVLVRHLEMKCDWLGEKRGVLEMRRMYSGYLRGLRGGSKLRHRLMEKISKDEIIEILLGFLEEQKETHFSVLANT